MVKRKKLLAGRERAAAMARHGAHAQLDRQGAHRPRSIPDKKARALAARLPRVAVRHPGGAGEGRRGEKTNAATLMRITTNREMHP